MKSKLLILSILVALSSLMGNQSIAHAAIDSPRAVVADHTDSQYQLRVSWINPTSTTLDHINFYWSYTKSTGYGATAITDSTALIPGQKGTYLFSQLSQGTTYYVYLTAVAKDGSESAPTSINTWTTSIFSDVTSPGSPAVVSASPLGSGTVQLVWTNPMDDDFYRTDIYRSTSSPVPGTQDYLVGRQASPPNTNQTWIDTGLTANTTYYYRLVSEDVIGNISDPVLVSTTTSATISTPPPTNPIPPTQSTDTSNTPPSVLPNPKLFDYRASWVGQNGDINTAQTAHVITGHPGDTIQLTLTLKNTGKSWWYPTTPDAANQIRLGTSNPQDRISPVQSSSWLSTNRVTKISQVVPTGGQYTFTFNITIPTTAQIGSTYHEYFRPLAEYVSWFGPSGIFWDIQVN